MPGNPEFGRRIRELREAKREDDPRFSLRKFAEAVGISATFMSKIENGEFAPPAPPRIETMAKLLEVDPDELLALANKLAPDLSEIIKDKPRAMADFLRTARDANLTGEEIHKLAARIRRKKE